MGSRRRGKSNDVAIFEALCGLAGFGVLLWMISPQFRLLVKVILVTLAFLAVAGILLWLIIREFKRRTSEAQLETAPIQLERPNREIFRRLTNHQPASSPVSVYEKPRPVPSTPELTTSQKLRKLDWFQFEQLVELIYRHRGFTVKRMGGAKPDGGVDLIVQRGDEKFAVQCKHWLKWKVKVNHIREFVGALTDSGIPKGIFITVEGYTADAKHLAEKHGIQILNETDVVKMLEETGLMFSKEISELFSDTRKFCPKCESEMVLRTSRRDGSKFWGCSKYPPCRGRLKYEA